MEYGHCYHHGSSSCIRSSRIISSRDCMLFRTFIVHIHIIPLIGMSTSTLRKLIKKNPKGYARKHHRTTCYCFSFYIENCDNPQWIKKDSSIGKK